MLAQVAMLWTAHRLTLVADFRREYGISVADLERLPATEWAQLTLGLSHKSRTLHILAEAKKPAGQAGGPQQKSSQAPVPSSVDAYRAAASRLRGRVTFVKPSGGSA